MWRCLPPRRRWYLAPIGAAGLAILIALNLTPVQQRVAQLHEHSLDLNGRVGFYTDALPLVAEHWQAGIGAGATASMFNQVDSRSDQSRHVDHLHSDPLEIILEYGIGGGLIILVGLLLALRLLWPNIGGTRQWYAAAALTGLLQIFLQSSIDIMLSREALVLSCLALCVVVAGGKLPPHLLAGKHLHRLQRAWPPLLMAAAAVALLPTWSLYRHQQDAAWGKQLAQISRNAQRAEWQDYHRRYVKGLLGSAPANGAGWFRKRNPSFISSR